MNIAKTYILMAALTALFGGIGFMLGGGNGMLVALAVAAAMNFGSWWFSDKMVLRLYGAKEVASGPVYDMTMDLARRAEIPPPRVYVVENPQPNAFATGRDPKHGAVAVTTGITGVLDERELRGVVAHELAHIKNRDTLIMTVTATIAGAIAMFANSMLYFGGGSGRRGGAIGAIAVAILAPLAAALVQAAVSRVREYSADRGGAQICGEPLALASALGKLEKAASRAGNRVAERNPATAHMFIVNPLRGRKMDNLFSTHPNTSNRIEALKEIAQSLRPARQSLRPARTDGPWG